MNTIVGINFHPAERYTKAKMPQAIQARAMMSRVAGLEGRLPGWTGPSMGWLGPPRRRRAAPGAPPRPPASLAPAPAGRALFGGVTRPCLGFLLATTETVLPARTRDDGEGATGP